MSIYSGNNVVFRTSMLRGFTLVELSIVLVLIGLITASIMGGKALLTQARLKALYSDISEIKRAVITFESWHDSLPGDMRNGKVYYPSDIRENGNGDGHIDTALGGGYNSIAETRGFWEALRGAELYTNYAEGPQLEFMLTNTVTAYNRPGALYRARSTSIYGGKKSLLIELGDQSEQFSRLNQVVYTQETISLDRKFDDGKAGTGQIKAGKAYDVTIPNNGCTLGNDSYGNDSSPAYNFADDTYECVVFFYME